MFSYRYFVTKPHSSSAFVHMSNCRSNEEICQPQVNHVYVSGTGLVKNVVCVCV